jgi:hypothetical protein
MSKEDLKRRTFLKISGLSSLSYLLTPIQSALSFSGFRMRHRRIAGSSGRLRMSQAVVAALVFNNTKNFKSTQFLQTVLAKSEGQNLQASQFIQTVLARDDSQNLRSSQTLLIVLTPT